MQIANLQIATVYEYKSSVIISCWQLRFRYDLWNFLPDKPFDVLYTQICIKILFYSQCETLKIRIAIEIYVKGESSVFFFFHDHKWNNANHLTITSFFCLTCRLFQLMGQLPTLYTLLSTTTNFFFADTSSVLTISETHNDVLIDK